LGSDRDSESRTLFDVDGVPRHGSISEWLDRNVPLDSRCLQAILRFTRTDGSIVFESPGRSPERLRRLDREAAAIGDPSLAAVVARWLPNGLASRSPFSPLPSPTDSRPDRVLAVLRPDWSPRGELIAVDHRQSGGSTVLEVASRGQVWLGPSWNSPGFGGKVTRAKPVRWVSQLYADLLEWAFTAGRARVTRGVVLLKGRSMAILSQQVDGSTEPSELRLSLGPAVEARFVSGSRAILLSAGPGKSTCRLVPLALPCHDQPTDFGSIGIEGREVVIRQAAEGRTSWIPILLAWDQPPSSWSRLTVAHRSSAVKPGQAFATRVAFRPRDPGLVIYRSLGATALRSFLGHQTAAKILVGTFTSSGEVAPVLKVDS
jgi:hypothetical protein